MASMACVNVYPYIYIYTDSKLNHFSPSHSGDSDSGVLPAVQLYTPSMLKNQPLFIST